MATPRIKKNAKNRRKLLFACGLAAVCVGLIAFLWTTHRLPFRKNAIIAQTGPTASQNTKGEPIQSNPQSSNPGASWPSDNKSPTEEPTSNTTTTALLKTPEGNFVSNHRPNLSGSPAPNSMQSSCSTTPGAMCQISFTKDGVTKSLPVQKTDAGGGTFWYWTLQGMGLTAGTWRIHAKATLGSQTLTADDQLDLVVSP